VSAHGPRQIAADLLRDKFARRHTTTTPDDALWDASNLAASVTADVLLSSGPERARPYAEAFQLLRNRWQRLADAMRVPTTPKES